MGAHQRFAHALHDFRNQLTAHPVSLDRLCAALATVHVRGHEAGHEPGELRAFALAALIELRPEDWSLRARILVELYRLDLQHDPALRLPTPVG